MKQIVTKAVLLMLILVSLSLIVSAVPSTMPQAFYGTISGASAGITISATVGGVNKGSFTLTTAGVYGCAAASCEKLVVCSDETCSSGDTISFSASSGTISTTTTYDPGAITELTLSYTAPSAAAAGESPAGGGGGGGVTEKKAKVTQETSIVSSIKKGGSATFKFTQSDDLGITQITITSKKDVVSPSVTVKETTWIGTAAIAADEGDIYKYLDITPTVITTSDIEKAVINFKVPKTWFNEGNYDADTVKLKKYVDNAWTTLATIQTSSDANHYYYEAESTSLSIYAITAKKKAAAPVTPPVTPPEEEEKPPVTPEIEKAFSWTGVIVIIVILLIGLVAYFYYKKKR